MSKCTYLNFAFEDDRVAVEARVSGDTQVLGIHYEDKGNRTLVLLRYDKLTPYVFSNDYTRPDSAHPIIWEEFIAGEQGVFNEEVCF